MIDPYKEIACGAVLLAVEDLQKLHRKTSLLVKHEKKDTLQEYMMKECAKPKSPRETASVATRILPGSLMTSMEFFKDDNHMKDVLYGLSGINGTPEAIIQQRDYCLQHSRRIKRKIARMEDDIANNNLMHKTPISVL